MAVMTSKRMGQKSGSRINAIEMQRTTEWDSPSLAVRKESPFRPTVILTQNPVVVAPAANGVERNFVVNWRTRSPNDTLSVSSVIRDQTRGSPAFCPNKTESEKTGGQKLNCRTASLLIVGNNQAKGADLPLTMM